MSDERPADLDWAMISLRELREEAERLSGQSLGDEFKASQILLASLAYGPDDREIQKFTKLPPAFVRAVGARLRKSGIWGERGQLNIEWSDPECGGIAFALDVAVALGLAERQPRAELRGHVCTERCATTRTAYEAGDSLETIGLRLGLSRERVRQILRHHGVPIRARRRAKHVCDSLCAEILKFTPPLRITAVAAALGCSVGMVGHRMRLHGIPARRYKDHVCGPRCVAMVARLKEHPDETPFTAARILGIPTNWVSMNFRGPHPEWPVREHRYVRGQRVPAPSSVGRAQ